MQFFLDQFSNNSPFYYFWLYSTPVHISYNDLYITMYCCLSSLDIFKF